MYRLPFPYFERSFLIQPDPLLHNTPLLSVNHLQSGNLSYKLRSVDSLSIPRVELVKARGVSISKVITKPRKRKRLLPTWLADYILLLALRDDDVIEMARDLVSALFAV